MNNLTNAVKEDNAPDVIMLDNPAVPDAASSGLLADAKTVGINTAGFDANLAGPGTVGGVTYGVPIGANTLGLYYNKDILDEVGRRSGQHYQLGLAQRGTGEGHRGREQGHHVRGHLG